MKRFLKTAVAAAVLSALALAASPSAYATITVTVKLNGVTIDSFSGGTPTVSKTYASLTDGNTTFTDLTVSASSNAPGTSAAGTLSQTSITALAATGTEVLEVDVSQSSIYTLPSASGDTVILSSKVAQTDGTNPPTFQSFATTTDPTTLAVVTYTTGANTFDPTKPGIAAPNTTTLAFVRGASYTLSNVLSVKADGSLNVQGTTSVTATPEPATVAMALTAIPVIALAVRRRRKASA